MLNYLQYITFSTKILSPSRFKLLSETRQKYVRPKSCSISEEASDPLIQALSESNLKPESLRSLGKTFFNIITGREDMVSRTANIVHVLGSLSVCVVITTIFFAVARD